MQTQRSKVLEVNKEKLNFYIVTSKKHFYSLCLLIKVKLCKVLFECDNSVTMQIACNRPGPGIVTAK